MNVEVGDDVPAWVMESVTRERMRTMAAILRDPNPVHWDPRVVASMRPGIGQRTINQGPLGLGYMVNMLHDWTGVGSIRRLRMTFPLPVLDGDRIVAMGTVTAVREEDGERLADCDIWLQREDDRPLIGSATVVLPD